MRTVETKTTELMTLAEQINTEHRACDKALRTGLNHAVRAGELLVEAKDQVEHGRWGQWLADNFEGSARTAQAYMKVAREIPNLDGAKAQRVADLSFREVLNELSAPTDKRILGPWYKCETFDELNENADAVSRGEAQGEDAWNENAWNRLAGEDRQKRAGWFREIAIRERAYAAIRDHEPEFGHWREQLLAMERIVRYVDIPPGRERFWLEKRFTYSEMHMSILEMDVVRAERELEKVIRLTARDVGAYRADGREPPNTVFYELEDARETLERHRQVLEGVPHE